MTTYSVGYRTKNPPAQILTDDVIVITTKDGKELKVVVNYEGDFQIYVDKMTVKPIARNSLIITAD